MKANRAKRQRIKSQKQALPSISNSLDPNEAKKAFQKIVSVAEAARSLQSDPSKIEQEMKNGEIPFGMWQKFSAAGNAAKGQPLSHIH